MVVPFHVHCYRQTSTLKSFGYLTKEILLSIEFDTYNRRNFLPGSLAPAWDSIVVANMNSGAIAFWNTLTLLPISVEHNNINDTPPSPLIRISAFDALQSLLHLLAHRITISMASITDGIHKAAAEALQLIGDVKWNIACTDNAPPHLTDLDEPLDDIRTRVNWLKAIKEEQWNSLWKPMPVHAREALNAIAETCKDLVKSCWETNEDGEPLLRIRVLTSGWRKRRIFAHRQALEVWQHSLSLLNITAKS